MCFFTFTLTFNILDNKIEFPPSKDALRIIISLEEIQIDKGLLIFLHFKITSQSCPNREKCLLSVILVLAHFFLNKLYSAVKCTVLKCVTA